MPDSAEASYQLVRGAGLALALLVVLAFERWRPHEPLRPDWKANLGLWSIDALAMSALCGACGWTLAAWAEADGIGLLAWAGVTGWIAVGLGVLGLDAVSYAWHRANHRVRRNTRRWCAGKVGRPHQFVLQETLGLNFGLPPLHVWACGRCGRTVYNLKASRHRDEAAAVDQPRSNLMSSGAVRPASVMIP